MLTKPFENALIANKFTFNKKFVIHVEWLMNHIIGILVYNHFIIIHVLFIFIFIIQFPISMLLII